MDGVVAVGLLLLGVEVLEVAEAAWRNTGGVAVDVAVAVAVAGNVDSGEQLFVAVGVAVPGKLWDVLAVVLVEKQADEEHDVGRRDDDEVHDVALLEARRSGQVVLQRDGKRVDPVGQGLHPAQHNRLLLDVVLAERGDPRVEVLRQAATERLLHEEGRDHHCVGHVPRHEDDARVVRRQHHEVHRNQLPVVLAQRRHDDRARNTHAVDVGVPRGHHRRCVDVRSCFHVELGPVRVPAQVVQHPEERRKVDLPRLESLN